MSWFNLNNIFDESFDANTSTFFSWKQCEEVVSGFRPHHSESLLPNLIEITIYLLFSIRR
ncbi:hypothetical protein Hanom_Chr11g00988631 [Helianthus anomalus]